MATVSAAITFVQQAGGWVVAEGIEEPGMVTMLLERSLPPAAQQPVMAGQGYLLGRPDEQPVDLNSHRAILDEHSAM